MKNMNKKYVCISIQSTAQFKYWNYPQGWEKITKHLISIGYEVYVIDKYPVFGGNVKNFIPTNAINKTGMEMSETINFLKNADFFIGISSGLSWLAWALNVPVILISGITLPDFEFQSGCERVFNDNVCNGCFCDIKIEFDKGDWMFCPRFKGTTRQFECTKSISPDMVISAIQRTIDKKIEIIE